MPAYVDCSCSLLRNDQIIVCLDIQMILQADFRTGEDQPRVGIGNDKTDRLLLVIQVDEDFTEWFPFHVAMYAEGLVILPVFDGLVDTVSTDSDIALPETFVISGDGLVNQDQFLDAPVPGKRLSDTRVPKCELNSG